MFEDVDLKILLGNSIPIPEEDYDDKLVESEEGDPDAESALMNYYFQTVLDSIGIKDSKSNYLSVKSKVNQYRLKERIDLANQIMETIKNVYDFEPSRTLEVVSEDEVYQVTEFLEFLEFNHEDFIADTWLYLSPVSNSDQLEKYCEQNKDKIISEIEERLETKDLPELISDFLRTNNKENLIGWFCERSKPLITAIMLRREEQKNV